MRLMKRSLGALLAVVLVLGPAAGCGDDAGDGDTGDDEIVDEGY
jgi:hypothetical protein